MENSEDLKSLREEISDLKEDIKSIKSYIQEIGPIMTSEEEDQLEESLSEHKEGKTKKLEILKEELGD